MVFVTIRTQITQRGVRMFRKFHHPEREKVDDFMQKSEKRIKAKRAMCKRNGIAFVLVRDTDAAHTNHSIAWGDIKALRYAIANLKRWI